MAHSMADDQQKNSLYPPPAKPKRLASECDAALSAVKLPEKALNTIRKNFKGAFIQGRIEQVSRRYRDTYCVLDYFKAENKEECLELLAERWALPVSRIQGNIAKRLSTMDFPIELMAQVKALQQIKTAQIVMDGQERRSDLKKNLKKAQKSKDDFLQIEQMVEETDKGTFTKTKSIAKPAAVDRIHAKIQDSHESEAKAHSQYMPKPAVQIDIAGKVDFVAEASDEMKEMLGKMRVINAKPTEAEIEDAKTAN